MHSLQCICDWTDRPSLFLRLENEVRRDLAAGRLPPVQPFHAMAYPFSAELALAISAKYVLQPDVLCVGELGLSGGYAASWVSMVMTSSAWRGCDQQVCWRLICLGLR